MFHDLIITQAQIYKRLADDIVAKGLQLNESDKKKEGYMQQVKMHFKFSVLYCDHLLYNTISLLMTDLIK